MGKDDRAGRGAHDLLGHGWGGQRRTGVTGHVVVHALQPEVVDDAHRDLVVVGGARPEEAGRHAGAGEDEFLRAEHLIDDLLGVGGAGDPVGAAPLHRQRQVRAAVVGDLKAGIVGEGIETVWVRLDPPCVHKERRHDVGLDERVDERLVDT